MIAAPLRTMILAARQTIATKRQSIGAETEEEAAAADQPEDDGI